MEVTDGWARIRQRNLEQIVAAMLRADRVPKRLIDEWLATSSDPAKAELSIEVTQKLVQAIDDDNAF